jgi:hypothetical protein
MLGVTISPNQSDLQTAMRSFMLSVLPTDLEVVAAQDNRVPEPQIGNYVVMTPLRFERVATNLDTFQDSQFTATIDNGSMTVISFEHGEIEIGSLLSGANVPPNTLVTAGPTDGGPGVYTVNSAITISTAQTFNAGAKILLINTRATMQLDYHSDDYSAGPNAQTVSLLFRDLYGTDYFKAANPAISPLYIDDAQQRPFINDQQQYEWRWVSDAVFQMNQRIVVAQQFAQAVHINLILADLVFPSGGLAPGTNPP